MRFWILAITIFAATPAFSQQVVVWPGDANNDGVVNTLDVLYIGVGYNTQGPARNNQGIVWVGDTTATWSTVMPDSVNQAYVDCNGNGFVDENDLIAIEQNYGLSHLPIVLDSFPDPDSIVSPPFYFSALPDSLHAGDTVTIDVFAGSNNRPANFFGVVVSFGYDATRIVANSVVATPNSMISSPVDPVLFFTATDTATNNLEIALSKRANTGGSLGIPIALTGQKLFSISFIIEDNLIGIALADPLGISLSNVRMYSQNLDKSSGVPYELSIPFAKVEVGVAELELNNLKIYPQPTNNSLVIDGLPESGTIRLTDLNGRTMLTQAINSNGNNTIDCSFLSAGMYLMQINTPTGSTVKKVLID